ncbi:hypothetical protein RNZ50_00420 [Paracoccaceae bacterium Fryx2]|nr:hypothetical protein [Paracoccaceae bacterium Fryx2]
MSRQSARPFPKRRSPELGPILRGLQRQSGAGRGLGADRRQSAGPPGAGRVRKAGDQLKGCNARETRLDFPRLLPADRRNRRQMEHVFETLANARLMQLRRLEQDGAVVSGRHIVPGAWFVTDTEAGEIDGTFASAQGILLRFGFDVRRPGRWLAFNLALDGAVLTADQVIGVIVDAEAPTPVPFHFSIRSGQTGAAFSDSRFAETHSAGPGRRTRVSLLRVRDAPALLEPAPWRNLRMVFSPASFEFCLHDARVFIASGHTPASLAGTPDPVAASA